MRIFLLIITLTLTACGAPKLSDFMLGLYKSLYASHVRYRIDLGDEKFATAFSLKSVVQEKNNVIFNIHNTSGDFDDMIIALRRNSRSTDPSMADMASGIYQATVKRHCPTSFVILNEPTAVYNFILQFNDNKQSRIVCQKATRSRALPTSSL